MSIMSQLNWGKGEKNHQLIHFPSLSISCSMRGMEGLPQSLTFLTKNSASFVFTMLVTERGIYRLARLAGTLWFCHLGEAGDPIPPGASLSPSFASALRLTVGWPQCSLLQQIPSMLESWERTRQIGIIGASGPSGKRDCAKFISLRTLVALLDNMSI